MQRSQGINNLANLSGSTGGSGSGQFMGLGTNQAQTTLGRTSGVGSKPLGTGLGLGIGQKPQAERPIDPLMARLYKIKNSYDPEHQSYRFHAAFYNTKGGTVATAKKPNCITDQEWNQLMASTPDPNQIPHVVRGFGELKSRVEAQNKVVEQMKTKLKSMQAKIEEMRNRYNVDFTAIMREITEDNISISEQLMEVLQDKETSALKSYPFSAQEHELLDRLERLAEEVNKPNKFVSALNTLDLKSKLMMESMAFQPKIELEEEYITKATDILEVNNEALESLINLTKRIEKATANYESAANEMENPYSRLKTNLNQTNKKNKFGTS